MPLWNLLGYAVSRWESQGMIQIPGLFPLDLGCLSRCTRSGNHKVRKRIRHSDQEVPLSGAESKEDPHPWTGLVVCKRPTESKSSGWAVRDTLSASLGAPTWFSGSTHPKCHQKREEMKKKIEMLSHMKHIFCHIAAYHSPIQSSHSQRLSNLAKVTYHSKMGWTFIPVWQ